ncbi:hypothetical protein EV144_103684 [Flavobacterium sp. 270]|uniref:hypothetical protein n=1 Tax=Flavobacterium sp. 270 TaxID=2512114 RepID=UPI001064D6FA|nr:hypothetical protein [Flavobacterium sp. 270]TDW49157.1 hypothetical protein EV144_103684 [Flavobacterium sp. 270]
MKNLLMLLIAVFFLSCQQKENKNTSTSIMVSDTNQTEKSKVVSKEYNKQTGDTIFMNFKDEKGFYTAESALDSIHSKIYLKFKNEEPAELTAEIVPAAGKGNIRFNQIISPDKSSDGPFGMDLKIKLEQKGNYILVIGHSQMADNPYQGKFNVKLKNEKK